MKGEREAFEEYARELYIESDETAITFHDFRAGWAAAQAENARRIDALEERAHKAEIERNELLAWKGAREGIDAHKKEVEHG